MALAGVCGARVDRAAARARLGAHFVEVHPGKLCTRMQLGGALAVSQRILQYATVSVGASLESGSKNAGERIEVGDDR